MVCIPAVRLEKLVYTNGLSRAWTNFLSKYIIEASQSHITVVTQKAKTTHPVMFLTDDCSLLELWILQSSKWQKADTFGRTLEISHLAKYFSTTQCLLLPLSDLKKVIERARREALKLTLACHWVCPQRMTVGYSIHNLSETWLVQGLTTRKPKKSG